jgi:hypothetical protein
MLPESSITLLENISSTGVKNTIVICLQYRPQAYTWWQAPSFTRKHQARIKTCLICLTTEKKKFYEIADMDAAVAVNVGRQGHLRV